MLTEELMLVSVASSMEVFFFSFFFLIYSLNMWYIDQTVTFGLYSISGADTENVHNKYIFYLQLQCSNCDPVPQTGLCQLALLPPDDYNEVQLIAPELMACKPGALVHQSNCSTCQTGRY